MQSQHKDTRHKTQCDKELSDRVMEDAVERGIRAGVSGREKREGKTEEEPDNK